MCYGIEPDEEGLAGLRLTAWGSVTTCTYRMVAHIKLGWVEEIPHWQESSCWTCHPNYYQEHPPPRLEDDDRL